MSHYETVWTAQSNSFRRVRSCDYTLHHLKPGIERVQALADISRLVLCCYSNETRALIANPPNRAQLEGTPTIPQVTSRSVQ